MRIQSVHDGSEEVSLSEGCPGLPFVRHVVDEVRNLLGNRPHLEEANLWPARDTDFHYMAASEEPFHICHDGIEEANRTVLFSREENTLHSK